MRKFLLAAAGFAALAGAAGVALAQNDAPQRTRGDHFFQADSNNDGAVTRAEYDAARTAHFARLDTNNDGNLTREERRAERGERGGRGHGRRGGGHMLTSADANSDGDITREEFLARPTAMFARMDADNNGVISASERPQRPERGERGPRGDRPERVSPDANNDGQLSRAEFVASGGSMFDRFDANNDGRVTREEMAAARPQRRGAE